MRVHEEFRFVDLCVPNAEEWNSSRIRIEVESWKQRLKEENVHQGEIVGIDMKRGAQMILLLIALIEEQIGFCFIPGNVPIEELTVDAVLRHVDASFIVEKLTTTNSVSIRNRNTSYVIFTSGTTAKPKRVEVPWTAIMPNVEDFMDEFNVSTTDTVLFTTSVFFDPSIIELFLSFFGGCRLVICPCEYRSNPRIFHDTLLIYEPTILQLTPAVVILLHGETISWIFGERSSVRILMIGGAMFPLDFLRPYLLPRSLNEFAIRVFNVYGVTEVSCWASIQEIEQRWAVAPRIPIGRPIRGTEFAISDRGELMIGGTRRCIINGEQGNCLTQTGDLVENIDGNLFITGRIDNQVKINGVRVNLESLSERISSNPCISFAHFELFENKWLILFVMGSLDEISPHQILPSHLPPLLRPSRTIQINEVPLNRNGKVDCDKLRELVETTGNKEEIGEGFWKIMKRFGVERTTPLNRSFRLLGIDSMAAAEIALTVGSAETIRDILDDEYTVDMFVETYLKDRVKVSESSSDEVKVVANYCPSLLWAFDTKKCIDASPLRVNINGVSFIIGASHSGCVVCIEENYGKVLWKTTLPNRIEGNLTDFKDTLLVGCHDGRLYILSLADGSTLYSFPTGDIIKSKGVVDSQGIVFVPSYDGFLYAFDVTKRNLSWKSCIGGGCPGGALLFNETTIILATLQKQAIWISKKDGSICRRISTTSPVFAPLILDGSDLIICSVDGVITLVDAETSTQKHSISLGECVFASAVVQQSIVFVSSQKGNIHLLRRSDLSSIRRICLPQNSNLVKSPIILNDVIVQVTTQGKIYVIKVNEPSQAVELKLGTRPTFGDILFTETCESFVVYCGSRDDWLRSLRFPSLRTITEKLQ